MKAPFIRSGVHFGNNFATMPATMRSPILVLIALADGVRAFAGLPKDDVPSTAECDNEQLIADNEELTACVEAAPPARPALVQPAQVMLGPP